MTTVLLVGPLSISFQRYPRPETGRLDSPPRSWGVLPIGQSQTGEPILPLGDDEAVWLGLSVSKPEVVVIACIGLETASGRMLDAVNGESWGASDPHVEGAGLVVPPSRAADGLLLEGRTVAFTRVAAGEAPAAVSFSIVAIPSRHARAVRAKSKPEWQHALDEEMGPPEGSWSIGAASDQQWDHDAAEQVRIRIVDQDTFARETGDPSPGPLRDDAPYKGWQLP